MLIKHKFTSAVADGADATLVRPSNWNDGHSIAPQIHNVTGADTLLITDDVETLQAGTYQVNLPAATGTGQSILVSQVGAGTMTLAPNGSDTVGGLASVPMTAAGSACLVTDEAAGSWSLICTAPPSSSVPIQYFYPGSTPLVTPINVQNLFGMTIEMTDGDVVVDGMLIDAS